MPATAAPPPPLPQAAQNEESSVRRELARATAEYNQRQAEEKRLRAIATKQAELAANMAEMEATLTSGMMTEDPNMAASAMSAFRVRKDHYKVRARVCARLCVCARAVAWAWMEGGRSWLPGAGWGGARQLCRCACAHWVSG